jgi:hypothetical protein
VKLNTYKYEERDHLAYDNDFVISVKENNVVALGSPGFPDKDVHCE